MRAHTLEHSYPVMSYATLKRIAGKHDFSQAWKLRSWCNWQVNRDACLGVYSTNLYTEKAQAWIQKTVGTQKNDKTFLYLAYRALPPPSPLCSRATLHIKP